MIIAFIVSFVVTFLVFVLCRKCIEEESDHIKDIREYVKRQERKTKESKK